MAGENVVSIIVKSSDDTKAGFDESKASAKGAAGSVEEYTAAVDRAAKAEADFRAAQAEVATAQERVDALQKEGGTDAETYAAAQDRLTQATLRSMDAQIKLGEADARVAEAGRAAGDAAEAQGAKAETSGGLMAAAGGKMKMAALGVAVGLGLAVKSAGDFQQQTTRLVTSAGESASKLGMVQQGILSLSSSTNTSTEQLAKGMYTVESAGFHAADGLTVLKAAAQGAQAEGADLGEVANAVTSGLNAYGMKAKDATAFTDEMVAAVGQGKMTMQDLAGSLSAVLPIAASAHISFAQVGGAIATMTAQGMSAQQAAQDLANAIRGLLNPNSVAVNEMQQMGISSTDVSQKLGQRGLTGTIEYLSQAITSHMGSSGLVIQNTFNQSKAAAADAETMLRSLPPAIQNVAKAYLDGSISQKQWAADLKSMTPLQHNLASEFATVANKAHGFSDLLKAGGPAAQTYAAAMAKMTGGATGLNVALMLTGTHAGTFNANVKAISDSAKNAGSDVAGWSTIQKEANFQIGSAEKAVKAMGDALGLALLPMVTAVLHPLTDFLSLVASNKAASIALATVVGGVLAGALGVKLAGAFRSVTSGITTVGEGLSALIGKFAATTAAEGEATAAAEGFDAASSANPIGLLVIAIAALVAGFIYLWTHVKGFRDFWIDVWKVLKAVFALFVDDIKMQIHVIAVVVDAVREAFVVMGHEVEAAVDAVVGFIRDHWKLLLAIILGPLGLIIDALATHWRAVENGFRSAWDFVSKIVGTAVGYIKAVIGAYVAWNEAVFKAAWAAVEAVFKAAWGVIKDLVTLDINIIKTQLNWFARLAALFRGWWDEAARAVGSEIDKLLHFVEQIPGRINSALGGLPGMMFRAGVNVIQRLLDGITSMIGKIGSVMGGIASKVAGFFGLSPAVEGPLSAGGAPEVRGQHFAADIARGMLSGLPQISSAAQRLAGGAAAGPGGAGGYGAAAAGASGPLALQFHMPAGGSGLEQMFWTWLKNGVREMGGDPRIFNKKVQFVGG